MMSRKEIIQRITLLEYENLILKHQVEELRKHTGANIRPMFPFDRIERHFMGCFYSILGYDDLKKKYR